MAAVLNISYCSGAMLLGREGERVQRHSVDACGPVLYNAAGTARLVSDTGSITGADKVAIPDEALAVNALILVIVKSGSAYVIPGLWADSGDDIASGEGQLLTEGQSIPLEIGRHPDGTQHTHLLIFGA